MKKIDIIILNYNGAEILPQVLPSITEAAKRSPLPCQVIVLDNRSTDNSIDYVSQNFPQVKIVVSKGNNLLFSYNDLLPQLDSDIAILLNNDVKVDPDFIAPLIPHFSSPGVFAVAPKQLSFSGKTHEGGKNRIEFRFGLMYSGPLYGEDPVMEKPGYTYYEANSAYDRKKLVELGMFDDILAPYLWEDADLGYRAWKAGYQFIYEPKSVIYHKESYTLDRAAKILRGRRILTRRNSFIFTWKNITEPSLLWKHILLLPANLLISIFKDWARITAFFEALIFLPRIIRRRADGGKRSVVSDIDILKMN
jgi:N-acetylglucosaminyl-diphospho-decaprenol L-rhamnosyltransferase